MTVKKDEVNLAALSLSVSTGFKMNGGVSVLGKLSSKFASGISILAGFYT